MYLRVNNASVVVVGYLVIRVKSVERIAPLDLCKRIKLDSQVLLR
jgi:hypothetical protein